MAAQRPTSVPKLLPRLVVRRTATATPFHRAPFGSLFPIAYPMTENATDSAAEPRHADAHAPWTGTGRPEQVTACPEKLGRSGPQSAIEPPRWDNDRLIGITEIRSMFNLGRTAAYQLTHRPGFPNPVPISRRCYRWWASEVAAFTTTLRQTSARASPQRTRLPRQPDAVAPPRRITGKVRPARIRKEAS